MDASEPQFDLAELCDQAAVTARTVRYYIQQGLLPQPGAGREARKYGTDHLNRLRLIRRLQREHLPLAEIRLRLSSLSDQAVAAMLAPPAPVTGAAASASDYLDQVLGARASAPPATRSVPAAFSAPSLSEPPAPQAPLASRSLTARPPAARPSPDDHWPRLREQWERLKLHDDVELSIRRPTSRDMNRRLERLLEIARRILHDD